VLGLIEALQVIERLVEKDFETRCEATVPLRLLLIRPLGLRAVFPVLTIKRIKIHLFN